MSNSLIPAASDCDGISEHAMRWAQRSSRAALAR